MLVGLPPNQFTGFGEKTVCTFGVTPSSSVSKTKVFGP
jgi:hypothetical protein